MGEGRSVEGVDKGDGCEYKGDLLEGPGRHPSAPLKRTLVFLVFC